MKKKPGTRRKEESIRSGQQFRQVYSQGRKFSTPYFTAFLLRTNDSGQRLGITVTRKIGNAVIRNRCKRRLREIFRLRDRVVTGDQAFDVVINVRSEMITATHEQLNQAFESALQRIRRHPDQQLPDQQLPDRGPGQKTDSPDNQAAHSRQRTPARNG